MKKLKFIRYGGLSKVNHKNFYKSESPHAPPRRKGIYVFLEGYEEDFLVDWKYSSDKGDLNIKRKRSEKRIFQYSGKIWTHLKHVHPEIIYHKYNNGWCLTDTDSIEKIFEIEYKESKKRFNKSSLWTGDGYMTMKETVKSVSKDFFELFIEKVN